MGVQMSDVSDKFSKIQIKKKYISELQEQQKKFGFKFNFHFRSSPRASKLERRIGLASYVSYVLSDASVVPPFFGQPSRGSSPGNGR